ncbi:MAG: alpha/beta hydrolase [Candidatus Woesebacteria bacterium]|jgi:hypothetical protein
MNVVRRYAMRAVASVTVAVGMLAATAVPAYACNHNSGSGRYTCQEQTVQVTLPDDASGTQYDVVGDLCYNGSPNGKAWEIDVAGFSYNSWYFDPTYKNQRYSSVRAAAKAGLVVFNYDQLGTGGKSDTPPAALLSLLAQADVLHQIIVKARSGQIGGVSAPQILVYGHSLGGEEALINQSLHPDDADVVVSMGYLRDANPAAAVELGTMRTDALSTLSDWGDAGFLTTVEGTRGFFHGDTADSRMIAADDANRGVASTATAVQAAWLRLAENRHLTDAITDDTIVLQVSGDNDVLGCDESVSGLSCSSDQVLFDREKQYFPNTCLATYSVADSGHDVGLHYDAKRYYKRVNNWKTAALAGDMNKVNCA